MNETFRRFVETLSPSFQRLMASPAVTVANLPMNIPAAGIYLFSEVDRHLYVGRTNSIRKRLQSHCQPGSGHNSATFAFRLARKLTGNLQATYKGEGSRADLEKDPDFRKVFIAQKERVRSMNVRYVLEVNPM